MYKILVVDDEPRVSMGIKKVLLESSLQISHVETACNGFEAIDYLRMDTYDLLLTDIQMSRMNGLELMETIYLEQPQLPIIVISAHEKFDFAKKSIQLGARDYLVKPVELEEMLRVVGQVLQERGEAGSRSLELTRRAGEAPRRDRHHEWLLELMTEQHVSGRDYEELTSELSRLLEGEPFGIVSVRLDLSHAGFSSRGISLADRKLFKYAAMNIVEESLYEWQGLTLSGLGNTLIGLIRLSDQTVSGQRLDTQSQLHLIGQMIMMNMKQYLNIEAIVGISTLHRDLPMLPKLLEEANAAVEWWRLHPGQKVFYYEDVLERENSGISAWIVQVGDFMEALKTGLGTGEAADPSPLLSTLAEQLPAEELFNSCFGMLVYRLYGWLLENGLDGGLSLQRFDPSVYFRSSEGRDRLGRLPEYIREATEMARMLAKERDQTILSRITGYIRQHFRNPALKIQDIASEVHFSTAYLSALFKRETGKNVWDYVTEQRIEEARRLLTGTDKKRYEIAYEVGYESPEHFSRMFKRYAGLSPADFRKEERRGAD
ncbi:response regulator transcription factor [Paenibacillus daejeonensis]|uniref:response regulator transcription factor n=1 Tax=Paenibacillus daejeonensis TaxID=135193 RepID=UPI0003742D2E|nr:response regulator [Paenibacillus daejeonensis]